MTKHAGRFRLSDMEFDFVSLVLAGDDPMARVVIAKAEPHKSGDAPAGRFRREVSSALGLAIVPVD